MVIANLARSGVMHNIVGAVLRHKENTRNNTSDTALWQNQEAVAAVSWQRSLRLRLDKWLKVSRLIKRRTVAQMACDQNRVFIDDKPAKSGADVKIGTKVHLELGARAITVAVLKVPDGNVAAQDASLLYEVLEEIRRPPEVLDWLPDDY